VNEISQNAKAGAIAIVAAIPVGWAIALAFPDRAPAPVPAGVILNAIEDRMARQREEIAGLRERVDALEDAGRPAGSGESPK
jgi:hypothetical protein